MATNLIKRKLRFFSTNNMRVIRLRECGLTSPRNRFRSVLNVRAIAMKRELRDKDLKFDERVAARLDVHKAWLEADTAYHTRVSKEFRNLKDDAYFNALHKLNAATERRIKRIAMLQSDLALVKAALRH